MQAVRGGLNNSFAGSILSGLLLSLFGKYKWVAILGVVISIVGTVLLVRLDVHASDAQLLVGMLVLGLGVGSGLAVYTVAVQNALPQKMGQVSSALTFFRQLGGTVGLAAMGSVLTSTYIPAFHNALPATLKQGLPSGALAVFDNPLILLSPGALAQVHAGFAGYGSQGLALFNGVLEAVKIGLAQSIHNVFILCLAIMIVCLVLVWVLKEIPLRGERSKKAMANTDEGTSQTALI